MKEATGEASMTGITIAIIAVVAAIAVPMVTGLVNSMKNRSCCVNDGGTWYGSKCYVANSCTIDEKGNVTGCTENYTPNCDGSTTT